MKQEIIEINGVKIPKIIDDGGMILLPVTRIINNILEGKNAGAKQFSSRDKYNKFIKRIEIDYSTFTTSNQIIETTCMTLEGFKEYLLSLNIGRLSNNGIKSYNELAQMIGIERIEEKKIDDNCDDYIKDIISSIKFDEYKMCTKCYTLYPKTLNFFYKDEKMSSGFQSVCRKCNNSYFEHIDKYLQYIYNKYGNDMYVKVRDSKTEDLFLMYAKREIDKFPFDRKEFKSKTLQLKIVNLLLKNNFISEENFNMKMIYKYIPKKLLKINIDDIFDNIFKDWKNKIWIYDESKKLKTTLDLKNVDYNSNDYSLIESRKIWNDYLKANNLKLNENNVYTFDFKTHLEKCKIYKYGRNDLLGYVMYLTKNKYYSYKFKINGKKYYSKKENRILALKQYIKDVNINYNQIPLYLSKYRLQQYSITLYNMLRKYYNCNLFEWVNDAYPDKFKHEHFNLECIRGQFDSMEECEVDSILRNEFKYKLLHNVSSDTYTIRILDETRQPDWFIFEDNKLWCVEYFGLYSDNPNTIVTKKYRELHDKKIEQYKNSVRNSHYYYLFLYPEDLKNQYKGLLNKIELMKNTNERIIGLK